MLYIVATPIGNLEDVTFRAIETLKSVDFILAEDTRITKRLLDRYEINKKMISYHHHTGEGKVAELVELIKNNDVALVTDAGTPGISDPGNKLISEVIKSYPELEIVPIPGPSAVTAALSVSGFPTDEFLFLGFIPHKKGREKFLREVLDSKRTVIFYESCHRIIKCLEQLEKLDEKKNGQLLIGRELTKKFETIYRGSIDEVLSLVKDDQVKGEFVVVFSPH